MRDMKWWMIALCMSCVLGSMVGVFIAMALWQHTLPKPVAQDTGHVTVTSHKAEEWECRSTNGTVVPCMYFDKLQVNPAETCEMQVWPHYRIHYGDVPVTYAVPCALFGQEPFITKEQRENLQNHNTRQ